MCIWGRGGPESRPEITPPGVTRPPYPGGTGGGLASGAFYYPALPSATFWHVTKQKTLII